MIQVKCEEIQVPIHSPFQSFGQTLTNRQSNIWTVHDSKHVISAEQCFYPKLIVNLNTNEKKDCTASLLQLGELIEQASNTKTLEQIFELPWFQDLEHKLQLHHLFAPQFLALQWIWLKTQHSALGPIFQQRSLKISGLVTNLQADIKLNGPSVWKIKIGRASFEQESQALETIFKRYPQSHFRLDANDLLADSLLRRWSDWAQQYQTRIEYIESPCPDAQQWNQLHSNLNLAIDLRGLDDLEHALHWNNLRALIVKPSLLSIKGVHKVALWVQRQNLSLPLILSSCFETQLGLHQIARMASLISDQNQFHGLGTMPFIDPTSPLSATINLDDLRAQ